MAEEGKEGMGSHLQSLHSESKGFWDPFFLFSPSAFTGYGVIWWVELRFSSSSASIRKLFPFAAVRYQISSYCLSLCFFYCASFYPYRQ